MTVMSLPSRFTSCQTQTIHIATTMASCVAFKSAVLTERTSFTNYKRSVLIQFPNLTFKMPAMISKFYKKNRFIGKDNQIIIYTSTMLMTLIFNAYYNID